MTQVMEWKKKCGSSQLRLQPYCWKAAMLPALLLLQASVDNINVEVFSFDAKHQRGKNNVEAPTMAPAILLESLMLTVLLYAPSISRKKFNVVVQLLAPAISRKKFYVVVQSQAPVMPQEGKKTLKF